MNNQTSDASEFVKIHEQRGIEVMIQGKKYFEITCQTCQWKKVVPFNSGLIIGMRSALVDHMKYWNSIKNID